MTTYISFESALHILTVAYTVPVLLLIVASRVGLAVIETIEEASQL
jgi:hypothetical protein